MPLDPDEISGLLGIPDEKFLNQVISAREKLDRHEIMTTEYRLAYLDSIYYAVKNNVPQTDIAEVLDVTKQRIRQLLDQRIVMYHKLGRTPTSANDLERREWFKGFNDRLQAYNAELDLKSAQLSQSESDDRSTDDSHDNHETG